MAPQRDAEQLRVRVCVDLPEAVREGVYVQVIVAGKQHGLRRFDQQVWLFAFADFIDEVRGVDFEDLLRFPGRQLLSKMRAAEYALLFGIERREDYPVLPRGE